MRVTVRVPATSANLGPGFDCFGLALDLCNEVTVDTRADPEVSWEGEGEGELPTDGTDMVSRAIEHVAERRPRRRGGVEPPRFGLRGVNRIPLERGLGSSAAAAVAGAAIADVLLAGEPTSAGSGDLHAIFGWATELEGHADNAAAATYGGFTIAASGLVYRFEPHPDLDPVVLVPERLRISTASARQALPEGVAPADAVFNVGHAALAAIGLTADPSLLDAALRDRLHEEARLDLVPEARELLHDLRRRRRIPACVSGAGPSLLAFPDRGGVGDLPDGWRAIRPGVRARGVDVVVED